MKNLKYMKISQKDVTEELFKQICAVENSTGSGYSEEVMREIWVEGNKNDNFACFDDNQIVAHISYNSLSKRRNGSIFMVNLTVLPDYRKKGIAQNLILESCKYYLEKGQTLPMSTSVDKTNLPAVNLYKKVGFEIKEPVCEIDNDDEQFILEGNLQTIKKTIENNKSKTQLP